MVVRDGYVGSVRSLILPPSVALDLDEIPGVSFREASPTIDAM
jgi:hypothetical protein